MQHYQYNVSKLYLNLLTSLLLLYITVRSKLSVVLLCNTAPFCMVWGIVNTLAWSYGSTQALPWGTVILLIALWALSKHSTFIVTNFNKYVYCCDFDM